jgi:hypothetical protein
MEAIDVLVTAAVVFQVWLWYLIFKGDSIND